MSPAMAAPNAADESQWPQANLVNLHLPAAWDIPAAPATAGDPPLSPSGGIGAVYVCVIDNGCQMGHAELSRAGNLGWDVVGGVATNNPLANAGEGAHATACGGIVAAEWGGVSGVVGIGPALSILSLAVPAGVAAGDLVTALNEARTHAVPNGGLAGHRRVIVMSGRLAAAYTAGEQANITAAINAAIAANIPVCVLTGDGDTNTLAFPATINGVIAVGGLDVGNLRIAAMTRGHGTSPGATDWGSNYGAAGQFVVAPGLGVRTTDISAANGYGATSYVTDFQGTGAAAAHAAGIAALLLSHNVNLTADDVRSILFRTAEKISTYTFAAAAGHDDGDWHNEVGYGRIHAQNAVIAARKTKARVEVTVGGSGTAVSLTNIPFRRTVSATIRLHHDNSNLTSPISYTLPALPANWAYDPGTPASPVVVQSAALGGSGHVDITILFTAPSAVGTHDNTITFAHDAPFSPSLNVTLHAVVITTALDMVLVLDRSGSMSATTAGGGTRAQSVVAAADLFVTLLEDEDALGIVRFDHRWRDPEDILKTVTLAGAGGRAALQAVLTAANLAPDGSTSIAGGMKLGMSVLGGFGLSTPRHNRAMVVMTDGHHNTSPDYPSAFADINAAGSEKPRVFALGVGLDTIDAEFDAIVSVTQGYKYQTGTIVTDLEVAELFTKILADAADADFAMDPQATLPSGAKLAMPVVIGETEFQVDFILIFDKPNSADRKRVKIWLEAPSGNVFDATDIVAGTVPNMVGRGRPLHLLLRVQLPTFAAAPNGHIGTWKLWVENVGKDENEPFTYSAMAMVKSDLRLQGHLVHPRRDPGEPFQIVAEPRLYRAPIELASDPVARVTRPDGVVGLVTLKRNSAGAYVGEATDTGIGGTYTVDVEAQVTTPRGVTLQRHLKLQTVVVVPGQVDLGGDEETPEGGTHTNDGGRPAGCIPALWCAFWRLFHCCGCPPKRR